MAPPNDREKIHPTWVDSDRFIPRAFIRPAQQFMNTEASSGIVMLIAAVVAIIWANAPFGESYFELLHTHVSLEIGGFHLDESLGHIINDGLMAIFFFVVGLEIKRELVLGELNDRRAATLPVMAAVGGMVVPALIYVLVAGAEPGALRGWGVPMATDIAFSLGVLSLLGRRVPPGAKLFLLALAIVDDIGGILVIAIFYTDELNLGYLGIAAILLFAIWFGSRVGVRSHVFYLPVALVVWYFFLESGVHATIAGVILGFLTPSRPMYGAKEFDQRARTILDTFPARANTHQEREQADYEALLLAEVSREAVAPLTRAEHHLQKWVSFGIIPIFALANAGVRFEGSITDALFSPVALGVAGGLVVGKLFGVSLFTWMTVRLGWGILPKGTTWHHVVGLAAVAGIGFTVALFIAALAFDDPVLLDDAKVGIFAGSIVAGIIGAAILLRAKPATAVDEPVPATVS